MEGGLKEVLRRVATYLAAFALVCGMSFPVVAEDPAESTFELNVAHGAVPAKMRHVRVKQGDHVRLLWTSDERIILHLHGYDIEKEVRPGKVTEFAFEAYATGRFPVAIHRTEGDSAGPAHDEEPLVYVEVYPR